MYSGLVTISVLQEFASVVVLGILFDHHLLKQNLGGRK
jgi:hypothetical protein